MPEVTTMRLRVDLECDRCYKKIKKLLCKFPEIRDQAFFEKENTVMIKVVCCSPHKIRDKLICKGGKTIKSIEIIVPEKPKPPPEKPKPPPEKPKEPEKPKPPPEKPKEPEKPKPPPEKPKPPPEIKAPPEKPKPADPPKHVEKLPAPPPVAGYPQFYPVAVCCKPCFDLGHGGPCHHSYGIPHQRPSSYDGYVKLVPSYDESYGGWSSGCRCNRSYGCRCEYFTEENPACTIM
ncbi:hypothetical protein VitviT2T_014765 [Vitis vinifera]|uniref:Protein PYRICULARIA ORYZAE RESISTANCE 21 n=3 Tax=Vitis vinifera TaxID=29760 RepID=D7SSJ7_VITVI|eukprot:XP_002269930.2 PREDICTED: protein PYRICULARIA ORYZAE RESISTANCE 21 isoform X1 [Vitis vinifera]